MKTDGHPVFPFIVGCGRSGTTLLRSMFDSHPDMAIPAETYFVVRMGHARRRYEVDSTFLTHRFVDDLTRTGGFKRMGIAEEAVRTRLATSQPPTYAQAIRDVYALYASLQGKVRYGDKTPNYLLQLPFLSELLPEARFIHIVRDGRDVAQALVDGGWTRRIEDAALQWELQTKRGRRAGSRLGPSRYLEVRYEELVGDPVRTLRSLCPFVDLGFDRNMLRYQQSAARWASASRDPTRHRSILRDPTRGLRDWRTQMSRSDLSIVERLVGDLLLELGYELGAGPPRPAVRLEARRRWARWQSRRIGHRVRRALPGGDRRRDRLTPAAEAEGT
jgi:hypothetical protein